MADPRFNASVIGELTKENAKTCHAAVNEMFEVIPKSKKLEYLGHLNEVLLFLESGIRELS